jgi:photosystem II biogenesis protein Psp29
VGVVAKIRTVSEAKRAFYDQYRRPINSIYRRFVEELLVEIHLLTVNVDFRYDPVFALGVVTAFDRFMKGYQPEEDKASIFTALIQAIAGNPNQYQQDAQAILQSGQTLSFTDLADQLAQNQTTESEHHLLGQTLNRIRQTTNFKYSRAFAIGLYTLITESDSECKNSEEKRNLLLNQLAVTLNCSEDKLQKDLDLYRSNLDKVDQLLTVLEDVAEAERKKREKLVQASSPSDSASTP